MINTQQAAEMMNEMANKGYENLRQLGELQMTTWNQLMEKQMTTFNTVVESAIAQGQAMSDAKDYQEAVRSQMDLTRKLAEEMVDQTRESVELVQQAGEKYRSFAETVVKEVAEEASKAA